MYLILLFLAFVSVFSWNRKSNVLGVFYVDWAEKLLAATQWLDDSVMQNDPGNWSKKIGFLDFLLNTAVNPRTINTQFLKDANDDLYRGVRIRYIGHDGDENVITSDAAASCTAVAQKRDAVETVEPSLYCEVKFTLTEGYVRDNKENGFGLQQRINREMQNSMRKLRECIDLGLYTKAGTLIGANPAAGVGAGGWTTLQQLYTADGTIDARGFDTIKNQMEDNFQNGPFSIVGLGLAREYFNRLDVGNVMSGGIDYRDVMSQFGMAFYKDHFTTTALGAADRVIVASPGLSQFYQYNLYAGNDFSKDVAIKDLLVRTTIQDPIYPIRYDLIIDWDKNCTNGNGHNGAWTFRLFTFYDLWTIPEKAFGDTYGELNDFNGLCGYLITEGT